MMNLCFIHCHVPHKNPIYCAKPALLFSIDCKQTWYPSRTEFSHENWQIHCSLISSRCQLSHATPIYDRPKPFCGLLKFFLEQLLNLGDQSVQHHRCLYGHLSRWSRVRITLVKPLQCFINTRNSDFAIVLKMTKVASLKSL